MLRNHFIKICLLSGVAAASGIATSEADTLPADLHDELLGAGLTHCKGTLKAGVLCIRARIEDIEAFSKKAALLGEGKVRVAKNTLSFERQGQRMELNLIV